MLVLTRKIGESIRIVTRDGQRIDIHLLQSNSIQVRIGVDAPKEITVHREEIAQRIEEERKYNEPN